MQGLAFVFHTGARAMKVPSAAQMRMARAALRWSLSALSEESGVNRNSLSEIERGAGNPQLDTLLAIQSAFEAHGIVFDEDDDYWMVKLSCLFHASILLDVDAVHSPTGLAVMHEHA